MGAHKPLMPFGGGKLVDAVIARARSQVERLAIDVPQGLENSYLYSSWPPSRRPSSRRASAGESDSWMAGASPAMTGSGTGQKRNPDCPDILPDLFAEQLGPLCGVVTGLSWCEADWLATFPCDTPFLPRDLVAQLARAAGPRPVVAKGAQVCGLWPRSCLAQLRRGLESGALRSVIGAVEALGGATCEIAAPAHAFFNVNTKDDLAEALRLSGRGD
jgi:molybdopterin-guanine dinucleotide biosynthesis protein A